MEWIDDADMLRASRAFDRKDYLEIAVRNADFLLTRLRRDGRLLRTYKDGESKLNGYLEDYAYVIEGLLALYEASFDTRWFEEARTLTEMMIAQFWDAEASGFFFTSADHEIDHAHEIFTTTLSRPGIRWPRRRSSSSRCSRERIVTAGWPKRFSC